MDVVLGNRTVRNEQAYLSERLYGNLPREPVHAPPGNLGLGDCSIRMLLTWVSHWRGAGAALNPAGVWPHYAGSSPGGPLFELGPVFSPQFPLLTDDQLIRLLCEGCPFRRPTVEDARAALAAIEPDVHNSMARMRAILCASLFHEWRDSTYSWRHAPEHRLPPTQQPGFRCALTATRAVMGRLIAGLSIHFRPQTRGENRGAFAYPDDWIPAAGFAPPPPPAGGAATPAGDGAPPPSPPAGGAPADQPFPWDAEDPSADDPAAGPRRRSHRRPASRGR